MERSQFHDFLERSLDLLAAEKAGVFDRLCATLDGCDLAFTIDGRDVGLHFSPTPAVVSTHGPNPRIRLQSSRQAILDVVAGRITLEDAVLEERVALFGTVPDLVRFHDALRVYLGGAVRAPGFAKLLEDYDGSAVRGTHRED